MVSDTLSDAFAEIEGYERDMPAVYGEIAAEIGVVKTVMEALRAYLDCPPSDGRRPGYDAAKTRLRTEIARLDLGGVRAALEGVRASWPAPEGARIGPELGYVPQEVLARAIDLYMRGGGRDQPSSAASEVDIVKHEVRLRNVNGLLATYRIGRNGEIGGDR